MEELLLTYTFAGAKPVLRGIGNCQYPDVSLSHTKGGVVVGISWDYRIGVDVEKGDRREILDNARYFCTDNELKQAILHNQRNNEGYFVSLWVAKEAILKSAGLGLLVNPTNIEIEVKTQKIVELRSKDLQPFDWELKICQPTVSHLLAVALSKRIFQ
ncbi:4'-phosphopantetheinyl transferase superfamily protein [Ochrobactrum grignonense]|nr:4'-phosphopantetheinyl transferase superfamily protein [Brucella grignonensis]